MGNFSIPWLKDRLEDIQYQEITFPLGDSISLINQSIEEDVFERYNRGDYVAALIRFGTFVNVVLLAMIITRCPEKLKKYRNKNTIWPPKKTECGLIFSADILLKWTLGMTLGIFKKCFMKKVSAQLIQDLVIVNSLRNAYAHSVYPLSSSIPLDQEHHQKILEGLKRTWQDLVAEYQKII